MLGLHLVLVTLHRRSTITLNARLVGLEYNTRMLGNLYQETQILAKLPTSNYHIPRDHIVE